MKTLFASILLLITIAIICYPLYIVWQGLTSDMPMYARIIMIALGLFLCWLVKPISILTGKDLKF